MKDMESKRLVIGKSVKRVTLQRFLVSKIIYSPKNITERDLWALFYNQLFLEGKARREEDFNRNFALSLELLARNLKQINLSQGLTQGAILGLGKRLLRDLPDFVYPKRNYPNMEAKLSGSYHIIFTKPEGYLTKDLPPKRYIGVGYKDKGSAKDKAVDASPAWQDIARTAANLERKIEEARNEIREANKGVEKLQLAKLIRSFRKELDRIKRGSGDSQKFAEANKH